MAYKEYDGLEVAQAIAKLKAKSFHDDEDKAFARARSEYFSPEELSVITGDDVVEDEKKDEAKAPEGNDANQTPKAPEAPEGVEHVDESLKLDELQALAAEAGLDTSGKKADLIERINTDRNEKAEAAK